MFLEDDLFHYLRFTLSLHPGKKVEHRIVVVMKTENGMLMKATPRQHKPVVTYAELWNQLHEYEWSGTKIYPDYKVIAIYSYLGSQINTTWNAKQ